MKTTTLAAKIHAALIARLNCLKNGNEYASNWDDRLEHIERELLPSGSGIDHGTTIERDAKPGSFVLCCDFHHMSEHGYYDGWTSHRITISPAFDGIDVKVSGRNRNDIKDYLTETFQYLLTRPARWSEDKAGIELCEESAV